MINTKAAQSGANSAADIAKLTLAALVLAGGIFAYYWYNEFATWQRILILLGSFIVSGAIGFNTRSGHSLRDFLFESNFELRKVVWPTRQETIQTTVVIFFVVVALSLILGLIDLVLKWLVFDLVLNSGH